MEDIALEVAVGGGPLALVEDEGAEAVVAGVLVGFGDDPGGGVGDGEVEDLALVADGVEGAHELGDAGGEVPPVDVEDVDVVGLQLLEAVAEGEVQGFGVVADGVGVDEVVVALVVGVAAGVLGCYDHLVAEPRAGCHPLPDPHLGLLVLVIVGRVDEIASLGVEVVEEFEDIFLAHGTHERTPERPQNISVNCQRTSQDKREEYQLSPKFMAPMHSGLTLTAAEGERTRCLPRMDLGGGAVFMLMAEVFWVVRRWYGVEDAVVWDEC